MCQTPCESLTKSIFCMRLEKVVHNFLHLAWFHFMYENFSFVRRLLQLGTILTTRLFGEFVGEDEFGNRYFRSRTKNASGGESRWVLYGGEPEASLVPPTWFGWLHHTCDQPLPNGPENRYGWQRPHQPNLSGTEAAPLPAGHPFAQLDAACRARVQGQPQSWTPPE